jgi:hypothetical protein
VTTTIVVKDSSNTTYTIVIPNLIDSGDDIPAAVGEDVYNAMDLLYSVRSDGVQTLDVESIDVQARISTKRRSAQIVNLNVPGGLKTGVNTAKIELMAYGKADTQTIEATFAIPAGVPLNGTISLSGVVYSMDSEYFYYPEDESYYSGRTTVAEVAEQLNMSQPNNALFMTYQARPTMVEPEDEDGDYTIVTYKPVETTVTTPWVTQGELELLTPSISAAVIPSPVAYGGACFVVGTVAGPSAPTTVTVYGTPAGSSVEQTLAVGVTTGSGGSYSTYRIRIAGLTTNTAIRVHTDGDYEYIDGNGYTVARVSAKVSISSSATSARTGKTVTLTAKVGPTTTRGGKVVFEYYNRGWKRIGTKTLYSTPGGSTAKIGYKVLRGSHRVRARYLGGTYNATGSAMRTIVGK